MRIIVYYIYIPIYIYTYVYIYICKIICLEHLFIWQELECFSRYPSLTDVLSIFRLRFEHVPVMVIPKFSSTIIYQSYLHIMYIYILILSLLLYIVLLLLYIYIYIPHLWCLTIPQNHGGTVQPGYLRRRTRYRWSWAGSDGSDGSENWRKQTPIKQSSDALSFDFPMFLRNCRFVSLTNFQT